MRYPTATLFRRWASAALVGGLVLLLAAGPVGEPPEELPAFTLDADDVNLGAPDIAEQQVAELIDQLGDPDYATREAASAALIEKCPYAFRLLARAHRTRTDYETRLRIEEIVRAQYLWHVLLKHRGFLGVVYAPAPLSDGTPAVAITRVAPDTAAEEAGLRAGDMVRGIDGEPLPPGAPEDAFRDAIQARGDGGSITFDVVRNGQVQSIVVILRARPLSEYKGAELVEAWQRTLQDFAAWWGRYFEHPSPPPRRTPSTAVLDIPE